MLIPKPNPLSDEDYALFRIENSPLKVLYSKTSSSSPVKDSENKDGPSNTNSN